jgi:flagellar P-ring protein precursor FlgI
MKTVRALSFAIAVAGIALPHIAAAQPETASTRLKDVASLSGVSSTPVIGYGLVVGLN